MKDSQREQCAKYLGVKYIKANNERFSTEPIVSVMAV